MCDISDKEQHYIALFDKYVFECVPFTEVLYLAT